MPIQPQKCKRVIDNVEKVIAIELLIGVEAIEFRRPLQSSPFIEAIITAFRKVISFNEADRILQVDLLTAIAFIQNDTEIF